MVYLHYISSLRYTILTGNPPYFHIYNLVLTTVPPQKSRSDPGQLARVLYSSSTVCLAWFSHECMHWNCSSSFIHRGHPNTRGSLHAQNWNAKGLRCPPGEWQIWGSIPACAVGIFPGLSHTSDLKIGTAVATLPGAWRCRVSSGTGWPSVSILWVGELESLICNFYLSVTAHSIVWADSSLRYTGMLLGR